MCNLIIMNIISFKKKRTKKAPLYALQICKSQVLQKKPFAVNFIVYQIT